MASGFGNVILCGQVIAEAWRGSCSGEKLKHFLARCILRSFSLPFKPSVAPRPPPEQLGLRAPVPCLTPPRPVWVAPRGGRRPKRVAFPEEPWGNATLPKWARETKVLRSPWKVGCGVLGLTRPTLPRRELNTRQCVRSQFWGPEACSQGGRSVLLLKALGEGPSCLLVPAIVGVPCS